MTEKRSATPGKSGQQERRNAGYTFTSESALVAFFSSIFPREEIREVIQRHTSGFVGRAGISATERKMQILNRIEHELLRMARSRHEVPSREEAESE